jgi:hypothetical protein
LRRASEQQRVGEQQHRDDEHDDRETAAQLALREALSERGAGERAHARGSRQGCRDGDVEGGTGHEMAPERGDRRERDDHQRGAHRAAKAHAEPDGEHRHDEKAPADAEESGEHSDAEAGDRGSPDRCRRTSGLLVGRVVAACAPPRGGRGDQHHRHKRQDQRSRRYGLVAESAEQRPGGGRDSERPRDPPADLPVARQRAPSDRGCRRDDHQRRRRGGTHALAEHVYQHGQRKDRTAATHRPDDQADQQPEGKR